MSMTEFDKIFHHRITGRISKDGTFTLSGKYCEVPCEFAGETPSQRTPQYVEDKEGNDIDTIFALDTDSNVHRKRHRPQVIKPKKPKEFLNRHCLEDNNAVGWINELCQVFWICWHSIP